MRMPWLSAWPVLPPDAVLRSPVEPDRLGYPLGTPGCRLYSRARHGLWHGLRELGMTAGEEILTPDYHHGSEVEALVRAGAKPRFYACDEHLAPDQGQLEDLLRPGVRALYITHYLGFPQDARRWRGWCDEHGLLLIEDAAQAWLATAAGQPVGFGADLSIFCLYKTFGVPDGAALSVPRQPQAQAADGSRGLATAALLGIEWLKGRSSLLSTLLAPPGPQERYAAEDDFALADPDTAPSAATTFLLPRVFDAQASSRRRANYLALLDELGAHVPAPFHELPDGASPFVFPVASQRKPDLLARLAQSGMEGLDLWSVPHPALPARDFPRSGARRAQTVGLPVHQELRAEDLERVAAAAAPARSRRPALVLEEIASFDSAREEWSELADEVGDLFATWEWASTWHRHFGGRLLLTAARDRAGHLVGVLPLYISATRPLRTMRFIGTGPADQLGPLCRAADRGAVGRALRHALQWRRWPCDLLVAEKLPREAGWSALVGGAVAERESSPVLPIDGATWADFLASRSANFRQQLRRRERRLEREHGATFRFADDPDRLAHDLEALFDLHDARWDGGSQAFAGSRRAFHQDFAAQAMRRGWLRLWFLEVAGRPLAGWYGFRFGGVEWYYQAGRDLDWEKWSVGSVLLAHTIRSAFEDGCRDYRFLLGDEPYKDRFATKDPGLETVLVPATAAGRAALAGVGAARRLPARAKRPIGAIARRGGPLASSP